MIVVMLHWEKIMIFLVADVTDGSRPGILLQAHMQKDTTRFRSGTGLRLVNSVGLTLIVQALSISPPDPTPYC